MEEKMDKAQKLTDKVNKLIEKLENETNIVKRTMYSIKAKMLIEKLNRTIELQEMKELFAQNKMDRANNLEKEKWELRSDIISIRLQIAEKEKELAKRKEYDIDSNKFMFGKEEVEKYGGIDEYIELLEGSGKSDQKIVASTIRDVEYIKGEIDRLLEEMQAKKDELSNKEDEHKKEDKNEHKELVKAGIKNKIGIFSRISSLFKNVKSSIKESIEERNAKKIILEASEEKNAVLMDEYNEELRKSQEVFEKEVEKLKEERAKRAQEITGKYEDKKQEQSECRDEALSENKKMRANSFKEELKRHAKEGNTDPKNGAESKGEEEAVKEQQEDEFTL